MIILFDKIQKERKKKNDNDSISSILYDYYDIQILKKLRNFF